MKKRNRVVAPLAALIAVLVVAAPAVIAAGPGEVVKVKTTLTISSYGYKGFVKSANKNCVAERKVVLKQVGRGVISRGTSEANGRWEVDLVALNENIKIPAKVFAVVKPITQATAGPIYKCQQATSKTVEIAGG
jgi:hypothetical protein